MLPIPSYAKDPGRSRTMCVHFVLPVPDVIAAILRSDRREALSGRIAVWKKDREKAAGGKSAQ